MARGKFKKDEIVPTVGDKVEIEILDEENKKGIINSILPRKIYIKRPKMANISQIVFVISLKMPKPDLLLLDKQLAYAEFIGINPIICINKIDLDSKENLDYITKEYENIGYAVIQTNAKEKIGIDKLKKVLKNNITAFSGNSGVGKSTLINSIFDKELTQEGNISSKIKRGKNTTTNTILYKISENEYIADTPGFSTFDIYEIESNNLDICYKEFKNLIKKCEYIGCNHIKEINCGVKKEVENNTISKQRYDRYCKIYNEIKDKEEHKW